MVMFLESSLDQTQTAEIAGFMRVIPSLDHEKAEIDDFPRRRREKVKNHCDGLATTVDTVRECVGFGSSSRSNTYQPVFSLLSCIELSTDGNHIGENARMDLIIDFVCELCGRKLSMRWRWTWWR